MVFYLLAPKPNAGEIPVKIYARCPQEITQLVTHYHEEYKNKSPALAPWAKKIPTIEELTMVEAGELYIEDAPIIDGQVETRERLKVLPDFTVFLTPRSVMSFLLLTGSLPDLRRANLYKIQKNDGPQPGLTFIPQDVMQAICDYNIEPHMQRLGQYVKGDVEGFLRGTMY